MSATWTRYFIDCPNSSTLKLLHGAETYLDIWHRAMGMRQQNQHLDNSALSVQTSKNHYHRAMVCLKSNSPHRPQGTIRTIRLARLLT